MNVIKMILIIGAIFGLLAFAAVPAVAQYDKVWVGLGVGDLWATAANWSPSGAPSATQTVHIPTADFPDRFIVVISSDDAACKEIDIDEKSRVEITGKTLTLGDSSADTTSTLGWGGGAIPDGVLRFVKDGSGNIGILKVHKTVTFDGGGTIDAPTSGDVGRIERAGTGAGGIVISSAGGNTNAVIGNVTLWCDVTNNGTGRSGAVASGQTMIFGDALDNIDPEPIIAGTGDFGSSGKVQFTIVTFATSAPDWVIRTGEFEVTDDAHATHWIDVPFDIAFVSKTGGLLDLEHDFSCTGKLTVSIITSTYTQTIYVATGKVAEFKP